MDKHIDIKHIDILIKLFEWYRCKIEKEGPVIYFWDNEYDRKIFN